MLFKCIKKHKKNMFLTLFLSETFIFFSFLCCLAGERLTILNIEIKLLMKICKFRFSVLQNKSK